MKWFLKFKQYIQFMILMTTASLAAVYLFVYLATFLDAHGMRILAVGILCYFIELTVQYCVCRYVIFKRKNRDILRFFEYWVISTQTGLFWEISLMLLKRIPMPFHLSIVISILLASSILYLLCKKYIFDDLKEYINVWWVLGIMITILLIPLSLVTTASTAANALHVAEQTHFVEPVVRLQPVFHEDGRYHSDIDWAEGLAIDWDDNWFFDNFSEYDSNLSLVSMVLARMAYTEGDARSSTEKSGNNEYLQNLGFEWMNTTSFTFRSRIADKFANLISGESNGATYIVAGKQLYSVDGQTKKLIMVSITGTLNFDAIDDLLMGPEKNFRTKGHLSFSNAAWEIADGFINYPDFIDDDTVILLTGHSRGGAVANLAGSYLKQLAEEAGIHPEVVVYSFACPQAAGIDQVRSHNYDTFFNVNNPYDLVPYIPFKNWGFSRYGTDIPLFAENTEFSQEQRRRIKALAEEIAGEEFSVDLDDIGAIPKKIDAVCKSACQSLADLWKPWNFFRFVRAILNLNLSEISDLHRLPIYLAFMIETH